MVSSLHVILNPRAGGGRGRRIRAELERELAVRGIAFTLEETQHAGHATALARAAAERGVTAVVAAGGDGTIHEVANGLLRARAGLPSAGPALGVVPIGTGNDFVKVAAGGTDRARAYDLLAAGRVRWFDVGRVEWEGGGEYFVNGTGTGIDVEVVRQINRLPRIPGLLSYLFGLLGALVRFRSIPLRLRVDGEEVDRKILIVAVCNGCCIGGGFYICPDAEPDDGAFDVCLVDDLSLVGIARVLPRVLRGTHGGMPEVSMRRARTLEIVAAGDEPLFFQLDGELREPARARWIRIQLERAVLPVLAARGTTPAGELDTEPGIDAANAAPTPGGWS